eukprot:1149237-Pelagomonas_calceolata.AAC.1
MVEKRGAQRTKLHSKRALQTSSMLKHRHGAWREQTLELCTYFQCLLCSFESEFICMIQFVVMSSLSMPMTSAAVLAAFAKYHKEKPGNIRQYRRAMRVWQALNCRGMAVVFVQIMRADMLC